MHESLILDPIDKKRKRNSNIHFEYLSIYLSAHQEKINLNFILLGIEKERNNNDFAKLFSQEEANPEKEL